MWVRCSVLGRDGLENGASAVRSGIFLDQPHAVALKRVIARQIAQEMENPSLTKIKMAARMQTSRSQLDRLLDPANDQVLLSRVAGQASCDRGR